MNRQIMEAMEQLRDAVSRSEEYLDYVRCRKQLEEDPDLFARVMEFRQREFRYQNGEEPEDREEERMTLLTTLRRLRREPAADAYFRTEQHLCRILQRTADEVLRPLDLHTDGLAD